MTTATLLFTAGEVAGVAALSGLSGLLLGWLLTRQRWRASHAAMRRIFEATLASADDVIEEQDRRLEVLESEPPILYEPLEEAEPRAERESPTGEIELGAAC